MTATREPRQPRRRWPVAVAAGGVIAVLVVVVALAGGDEDAQPASTAAPRGTQPCGEYRSPRPAAQPGQREVKVFFDCDAEGDGGVLTPVYRRVPRSTPVLRASLEALVRGPAPAERDAGLDSLFSDATAGTIRGVTVRDGHAVVDFEDLRGIIPNASSSAGSASLLSQLDATVFQLRSVTSVEYRLEGSCEAFGEWLQYGGCDKRTRSEVAAG